jgi:hypothetical protein
MLTRLTAIIPIVLLCLQAAHAQKEASPVVIKELQAAEAKMFRAMLGGDKDYCRNYLADDYFSINADGSTSTKEQVCADTLHGKFFSQFTYQYFDKKTRVYDNVAVLTGRVQAFLKEALAVEFLYTAVFVNQKGKWLFASWQGTISKDSPKPPSR